MVTRSATGWPPEREQRWPECPPEEAERTEQRTAAPDMPVTFAVDFGDDLLESLRELAATFAPHDLSRLAELEQRVTSLEESHASIIVPIQSLEPCPYDIIRPIQAVVQEEDGVFVASFFDANINASGESQLDAVEMLKEMLASTFRLLLAKESALGKGPQRQLAVLRQFIQVR